MRIRDLRMRRKLTQDEVAEVLGLKQPAYCDLENGISAFKAVHLDKLAGFYGLSLDELLHGDQPTLNMCDNASHGYLQSHVQNTTSEELLKRICDLLETNTSVIRELAVLISHLNRRGDQPG